MARVKRCKTTRRRARTSVWKRAFLAAFAQTGVVLDACDFVPVDHSTVYREIKKNPKFAREFEEARKLGAELLVKEATRRATQGVSRMKFFEGQLIRVPCEPGDPAGKLVAKLDDGSEVWSKPYLEHEYSDALLALLLKRHFPAEFREKTAEVSVSTSSTTNLTVVLSEAQLSDLQARRKVAMESLAGRN